MPTGWWKRMASIATVATRPCARVPAETPWANLWLANATAGYPSVAGTVRAGFDLYQRLARG